MRNSFSLDDIISRMSGVAQYNHQNRVLAGGSPTSPRSGELAIVQTMGKPIKRSACEMIIFNVVMIVYASLVSAMTIPSNH